MRWLRLILVTLYAAYLVQAGLLMLVLPWSQAWPLILLRLPATAARMLDAPAARGAISGLGVLHLLLVIAELGMPTLGTHETPRNDPAPDSES